MKTKNYRYGKTTCKTYYKAAGNGTEVGFNFNGKTVFVGNFIHTSEANKWWSICNAEIKKFNKRYTVGKNCPVSWYAHFMQNHLYREYYRFLNREFSRYSRNYTSGVNRDIKTYKRLSRNWGTTGRSPMLKAA